MDRRGSPETARQEARRILGEVAKGADPMADKIAGRKAITVAELCRQYLADVEAGRLLTRRQIAKKESTLISDRGRIARHIIPLLGRKSVTSVTRERCRRLHARCRRRQDGWPGEDQATRSVDRARWPWCRWAHRRHCSARSSPMRCARVIGSTIRSHGVVKFAEGRRQRRLTDDEYRMLGMALSKADQAEVWKPAIAATWLMILTGWRRGEVLGLRWSEIDLPRRTARLADTKTGASLRALSEAACAVIQCPAEERRCGVRQSIRRESDRRLSEDVVEDRQAG